VLDEAGNQKPATCFTKVVYNLHPSFANPVQSTFSPLRSQWRFCPCTYRAC
jgi:transcription initiation factor IIF auxiliary subunit